VKTRVATTIVCVLYLSVALFFGVVHHHHDVGQWGHHDDCAACAWQLKAAADVPIVVPPLFTCAVETPLQGFDLTSYSAPSFSFSLSRAPPAVSA
jgi:hypothetical protein